MAAQPTNKNLGVAPNAVYLNNQNDNDFYEPQVLAVDENGLLLVKQLPSNYSTAIIKATNEAGQVVDLRGFDDGFGSNQALVTHDDMANNKLQNLENQISNLGTQISDLSLAQNGINRIFNSKNGITNLGGGGFNGYNNTNSIPNACINALATYLQANPTLGLHSYNIVPVNSTYTSFMLTAILVTLP